MMNSEVDNMVADFLNSSYILDAIRSILDHKDVVVLMPTGGMDFGILC